MLDTNEVLGVITWGFAYYSKETPKVRLFQPTVTQGPVSDEFKKAIGKANGIFNNDKLGKPVNPIFGGTSAVP